MGIRRGHYSFPEETWANVSDGAKLLVTKMMKVKPQKRITATQILSDPWLEEQTSLEPTLHEENAGSLRKTNTVEKLRHGVRAIMTLKTLQQGFEEEDEEEVDGDSSEDQQ